MLALRTTGLGEEHAVNELYLFENGFEPIIDEERKTLQTFTCVYKSGITYFVRYNKQSGVRNKP
jgi:hypothetical protein